MRADLAPIEIMARALLVPDLVSAHPNFKEACAVSADVFEGRNSKSHFVVTTANHFKPELYGWRNPVPAHRDLEENKCPSYVYFVLLSGKVDAIGCKDRNGVDLLIHPVIGDVVRLEESHLHWTEGSNDCVALFMGCFQAPVDDIALSQLQRGIFKLSKPHVYNAPRVSPRLRQKRVGEAYAHSEFGDVTYRLMSNRSIQRFNLEVLSCFVCDQPACRIDKHWPYDRQHRCEDHITQQSTGVLSSQKRRN